MNMAKMIKDTPIAAVSSGSGLIDLFGVADSGGGQKDSPVSTAWWRGLLWGGWTSVKSGASVVFPKGTPIAAVSSEPGFIDLFGAKDDGRVYTASWRGSNPWGGWAQVGKTGTAIFNQLTPMTAVSSALGFIDVFGVDTHGFVNTASWRGNGWGGWSPVASNVTFPQHTPIAGVSSAPGFIDLYGVANPAGNQKEGAVVTAFWRGDANGWFGWAKVRDDSFPKGTPIAAVSSAPGFIDLFAVKDDGLVYSTFWRSDGNGWGGWYRLPQNRTFSKLTPIAAVSSAPGFIDVFGVGTDGLVYTASWRGKWGGWSPVLTNNDQHFPQLTPIAAVSSALGLIDLFAIAGDGLVHTASWRGSNPWGGWSSVGILD
jgi:hypothetical protein